MLKAFNENNKFKYLITAGGIVGLATSIFFFYRRKKKNSTQIQEQKQEKTFEQEEEKQQEPTIQAEIVQNNENNNQGSLSQQVQNDNTVQQEQNVNDEEPEQLDRDQLRKQLINELKNQIELRYNEKYNSIDLKTIHQIYELSIELVKNDYIELTFEHRNERRNILKKLDETKSPEYKEQYEQLIINYLMEVDDLLLKAQNDLLQSINLTEADFDQSVHVYMDSGFYQEIIMTVASIKQRIKEVIPSKKQMNNQQIKELISYQLEILEQKPQLFQGVILKLINDVDLIQLIPTSINAILQDIVFGQFQIEEEDQMRALSNPQILQDIQIIELIQGVERATQSIVMNQTQFLYEQNVNQNW